MHWAAFLVTIRACKWIFGILLIASEMVWCADLSSECKWRWHNWHQHRRAVDPCFDYGNTAALYLLTAHVPNSWAHWKCDLRSLSEPLSTLQRDCKRVDPKVRNVRICVDFPWWSIATFPWCSIATFGSCQTYDRVRDHPLVMLVKGLSHAGRPAEGNKKADPHGGCFSKQ